MPKNAWPSDVWQVADPVSLGMDANQLSGLESEITSNYGNMNGIVIVKSGFLTYEKYFNGYGPDDAQHVASVTKTVLSVLVGMAVKVGVIRDVNQKVLDFFRNIRLIVITR